MIALRRKATHATRAGKERSYSGSERASFGVPADSNLSPHSQQ